MSLPEIDIETLHDDLLGLLRIPSPTGYTDRIVHHVVELLTPLGCEVRLTRRGAIRARFAGEASKPARAITTHLDTIGAIVCGLNERGRLSITSIGTWSARFAEGARVTVYSESGSCRGTILPLKSSGHVYNEEIDTQPVAWSNLEVRVDRPLHSRAALEADGFQIGDFVAIDPTPEVTDTGYVVSRHLDDKAGVAAALAAARALAASGRRPPVDTSLLFTISEEVGSGASTVLHGDIAEMVAVDNATPAPGQGSIEDGATIAMADSSGPFDFHLTRHLLELCREHDVRHARDLFRFYRCDAASAVEAGNDLRTALIGVGVDASHGYERTHLESLCNVATLLLAYMLSPPTFQRDRSSLAPLGDFQDQPTELPPGEPLLPREPWRRPGSGD